MTILSCTIVKIFWNITQGMKASACNLSDEHAAMDQYGHDQHLNTLFRQGVDLHRHQSTIVVTTLAST